MDDICLEEHNASLASVITPKIWSYIYSSVVSWLLLLSAHLSSQRLRNLFRWLTAAHSPETLCIQSDISLCVFSGWTCAGMSCVMCEPYDSYLSNGSTLTHYLGFESDHSMNTREKTNSSWATGPNFLFGTRNKTAALGHTTRTFSFLFVIAGPDGDFSTTLRRIGCEI